MKEITQFFDPEEAHIAAGFLRSHGLEVVVADDLTLGAQPHLRVGLGGYRLMAPERDANIAIRLLADIQGTVPDATCPQCGSHRIAKRRDFRFPLLHTLLLGVFPFAAATDQWRCRACRHTWRRETEEETDDDAVTTV